MRQWDVSSSQWEECKVISLFALTAGQPRATLQLSIRDCVADYGKLTCSVFPILFIFPGILIVIYSFSLELCFSWWATSPSMNLAGVNKDTDKTWLKALDTDPANLGLGRKLSWNVIWRKKWKKTQNQEIWPLLPNVSLFFFSHGGAAHPWWQPYSHWGWTL